MSSGDIDAFLKKLFASEGGADPKVINRYGYIGKYQFGEDALADLGYYKKDGTKNRNAKGKFEYDWVGEWSGKNGIHSLDDFLTSEPAQDRAAREWVELLCKKMKHFKLQQYVGKTIKNVKVSESGIIAAAHLKGYGSQKYPGVIQFLKSNGEIDSADANGTHVSVYMRKFAGFDLGCCGSVAAVLIDRDNNPISGLKYQLKIGSKVVAEGKTDPGGATEKVSGLDNGASVTLLVSKLEGGFKEIASLIAKERSALVATLRSAKRMVIAELEKHLGHAGDYNPQSEAQSQSRPGGEARGMRSQQATGHIFSPNDSPGRVTLVGAMHSASVSEPQSVTTNSELDKVPRDQSPKVRSIFPQVISETDSIPPQASAEIDAIALPTQSSGQAVVPDEDRAPSDDRINNEMSKLGGAGAEINRDSNAGQRNREMEPLPDYDSAVPSADVVNNGKPQLGDSPYLTESMRDDDGHPVAVAKPVEAPSPKKNASVEKLEEILKRNTEFGRRKEKLSGLLAAEQSRKGNAISPFHKERGVSLGSCYKYVKIALLASGMTRHYLGGEAAKNAGKELENEGYLNLLDNSDHGLQSPFDAPTGAVIVYDVTDGTLWGHIEVRVSDGFASDYFSERPRTIARGETREKATMAGRQRKVIGIWVKG